MPAEILGISGSPIKNSNTDRAVQRVLEATGLESEFIKLSDHNVQSCRMEAIALRILTTSLLLILLTAPLALGQADIGVLWRGVDRFDDAEASNVMDAIIRPSGTAGGVSMSSIFLHPLGEGRSTLTFETDVSTAPGGTRVFLLTHVGIADGFAWDDEEHLADGARFYITADGDEVLAQELGESRWGAEALALDTLPSQLVLATDCGTAGNVNYDWAMFGDPRLVALPEATLRQATAVRGANGLLVVDVSGGEGELIIEGVGVSGQPVTGATESVSVSEKGLTFTSFDLSEHETVVAWQWRGDGLRVDGAWGGSWQPEPKLAHVGPARGVIFEGDELSARVAIANEGRGALLADSGLQIDCNGVTVPVGGIKPGESVEIDIPLGAAVGDVALSARIGDVELSASAGVWPALPILSDAMSRSARALKSDGDYIVLENARCRWLIDKGGRGAIVYARVGKSWEHVGSVAPWATVATTADGPVEPVLFAPWEALMAKRGAALSASAEQSGVEYELLLTLLDADGAVRTELRATASESTEIYALWGPAVLPGDGGTGADKGIAVFPGLEYLEGDERSSGTRDLAPPLNERWTPHKFKVTVPWMFVQTRDEGPILGLAWDPTKGEPAAAFASPNLIAHQDNHLLQLGLPSIPDGMPESARRAEVPLVLDEGESVTLTQHIVAQDFGPDVTLALEWFDEHARYPEAEAAPRSFEEGMALSRHGFLEPVWDEETGKSTHYVGAGWMNAPGFATLMLMDGRAVAEGDAKQQVLDRVETIAANTIRDSGHAGLASASGCHIMGWEFPYHWGHVPGALAGMRANAYGAMNSQESDGGWGFYPDERHATLGEAGTKVMGTCARNAYVLAKWVAVSGDPVVEAGLRRALVHMGRYTVPRGAQGWECPIMQPDVLASAYAVRAYVWAAMALDESEWLDEARYWARTGLPFQYAWDDGEHPGMRYASIPVFGSTFHHHSWIGLPVQWCGLVYAYGLQELMRFDDNDLWRRQIEGITVSAQYQQWPFGLDETLTGTYPDSYGPWFTRRNGVHINPEDIVVNALGLEGFDPGLRSVAVKVKGGLAHVSGPGELRAKVNGKTLNVELDYLPGEIAYISIAPVLATGLETAEDLGPGETGAAYVTELAALVMGAKANDGGIASFSVPGIRRYLPAQPKPRTSWEFRKDAEGWETQNDCNVNGQGGSLTVTTTGDDPYVASGPCEINATRFPQVKARVRLTGGGEVGLFWRSSGSPAWGPDKEVQARVKADGDWHEIAWDLGDHASWSGTITQLRLDVEGEETPAGTVLDVEWIRPAGE